jgi:hypothetical protein
MVENGPFWAGQRATEPVAFHKQYKIHSTNKQVCLFVVLHPFIGQPYNY